MATTPIWVSLTVGFTPIVAASVVLLGGLLALRQKTAVDERQSWWTRVEWAASLATSAVSATDRIVGIAALQAIIGDSDIHERDGAMLEAILTSVDLSRFDPEDAH